LPHHTGLEVAIAAASIQESDLRIERAADLDESRHVAPVLRLVTQPRAVCGGVPIRAWLPRGRAPPVDGPGIANADPAVDAVHAVPVVRVAGGHALNADDADARARGELVAHTRHGVALMLGEDLQGADGEIPDAAGD